MLARLFTFVAITLISTARIGSAQPRWTLIQSDTHTIIGDQSAGTLGEIATEIDQFREVVSQLVGTTRPPALPTIVYVFGTQRVMEPYLPLYSGKPIEADGLYAPDVDVRRIILSVQNRDRSTRIAFHEYTHLLVGNAVRGMPVWLGEGLAEYFSTYRLVADGRRAEAGHPIAEHLLLLRERFVPILELLDTEHSSKLYNEGDRRTIFYAESWALTHFILSQSPNGRAAINTYVTQVNAGASPADAVQAAFGITPAELERRVRQYVHRAIFSMVRYELSTRIVAAKAAPRTLGPAEAEAWLGDLQRAVQGQAAAAARIEAAAAKAPDVAIAHLALGRLRAQQDRLDEARTALARAAALAPDDFMVQLAHGVWLARGGGRLVADAEVVASLRRATRLNPESSEAHALLAVNLMLSPATLGEARTSIERAIKLAPGRLEYVLSLADMYLADDLIGPARALLTAVAAVKSDERASAAATSRLASIAKREEAWARIAAARERSATSTAPRPADAPASELAADANAAVTGGNTAADRPAASGVDLTSAPSVYAPTRLVHSTSGERLTLTLRRPKPDEQRVFATLTEIECRPGPEVRFHVAEATRTLVAKAARFSDVELTGFKPGELVVACGRRSPGDTVALTWRPAQPAAGDVAGTAVAIEFLPDGFGPIK